MARSLSRYERTRCHRRGWAFERGGWAVLAAILAAAAAGLFGGGSLSEVEATAGGTLAARYPRFARAGAPLELEIEWTAQQSAPALWIARAYLDRFEVEEMRPAPAETVFDRERIYYTFRAPPDGRFQVVVRLRPQRGGRLAGALGVGAAARLELRQLIFP